MDSITSTCFTHISDFNFHHNPTNLVCSFLSKGVEMDSVWTKCRTYKSGREEAMRTTALGPFVLFQRAEFSTLHLDHMSLHICVAAYVTFKSF